MKSKIRISKSETILKSKILNSKLFEFRASCLGFPQQSCGQAAIITVIFLLIIMLSLLAGVSGLAFKEAKAAEKNFRSRVAFFTAEAGVDDAVYRLMRGKNASSSFLISLNGSVSTTTVTDVLGTKQIVSSGEFLESFRFLSSTLISGEGASFFYGAQVGDGGLIMDNNSRVEGNVFSNGSVDGDSGAVITGSITVAGSGKGIEDISVEGNAFVDECEDADINGTLYTNNEESCSFGSIQSLGTPPNSIPLPITAEEIQEWKDEAQASGVTNENIKLDGSDTATLGPRKIVGNLDVENSAILTLSGNLWVTGNVTVKNDAQVKLSSSFGGGSGIIIADGTISLENNSISSGSGSAGSYLMYLSTNIGNSVLTVKNDANADIVYTSAGGIVVENNSDIKEVTGYRVEVKNNAVLTYESGLQNINFVSGPSGGWSISEWKEVIQ